MCPFWGFRKPTEFKCILGAINGTNVRGDRQCSGEELLNYQLMVNHHHNFSHHLQNSNFCIHFKSQHFLKAKVSPKINIPYSYGINSFFIAFSVS